MHKAEAKKSDWTFQGKVIYTETDVETVKRGLQCLITHSFYTVWNLCRLHGSVSNKSLRQFLQVRDILYLDMIDLLRGKGWEVDNHHCCFYICYP